MYCPNCGTQLVEGTQCCPRCGLHFQGQQWIPHTPPMKKKHSGFSKIIGNTIGVIFICIFLFLFFNDNNKKNGFREPEAHISATELIEDYKSNEPAADGLWKNRRIAVKGTVDRIGVSFGDPYVVLTENGSLNGVRCYMDKSRMNEAAQLKKGYPITVIGDVSNYIMGDVLLHNCQVYDKKTSSEQDIYEERRTTLPAPEMQINASQLAKVYEASGGSLMRRCISVEGIVDHIEKTSDDFIIILNDGVRCIMDTKVHFAKGQQVILAGIVSAYHMGSVDLKGCHILGEGPVPKGRTAGDAPELRPADAICAKTASWDAWFNASKSFRKEHPECRPNLNTLQAPSISADRLAMEYRENEVAAEEAYKDRILIVTGKVRSVETDMSGNPCIWLQTKSGRGVLCDLAYSQRRSVATLRKGQTVSIVGKIGMAVMRTPTVDDAFLLDK